MKKIYGIFKKIIFSFFFLYGFNVLSSPLNMIIPINLITVLLLTILGIPSLFGLVIIKLFIF